ncbi:MAG: DMT family transporter [bacterium]
MGIFFALVALFSWGFGDFLIQRSTRKFGSWIALFFITLVGAVTLTPFVWNDLSALLKDNYQLAFLLVASFIMLFAAWFDFQALKIGKISVIEPILAMEVPVTAFLAAFLIHESLSPAQSLTVLTLLVGVVLVSIKKLRHLKKINLETGVGFAVLATIAMGVVNFLFGVGARTGNPLMIKWFTDVFLAIASLIALLAQDRLKMVWRGLKNQKCLIGGVCVLDNLAWVAFSLSVTHIPITIATSLSESYIALAALLGLILNREKLNKHQLIGLIVVVISASILAYITS